MAIAEVTNLTIYKGTDFEATFNLFDSDNTTAGLNNLGTSFSQIRKYPTSPTYEDFTVTVTPNTGVIRLALTAEQTARLKEGRNYFDIVLTVSSKKVPVLRGTAMVEETVSL